MSTEIVEDALNEVLDIVQRQKRAQITRANKKKLEIARRVARGKMASQKNLKKRAYAQARKIVRRKFAGKRGEEYETLGPAEKMVIDKAVEGKVKLIKKIAARLLPRIQQAESKRLSSFIKGKQLQNLGTKERKTMNEEVNKKFGDKFKGQKSKRVAPQIKMYNKFSEEALSESAIYKSLIKKADKSEIDIEILGEVFDRGLEAWTPEQRVSREQYAFARVNSYINQGKSYFNEDADLQEISNKTLGSYVKKASRDAVRKSESSDRHNAEGDDIYRKTGNIADANAKWKASDKLKSKSNKRLIGVSKAVNKLSEEELTEQFKVGDKVHIGLSTKGGAGYVGTVYGKKHHNDEPHLEISFGHRGERTAIGPERYATKINEDLDESNNTPYVKKIKGLSGQDTWKAGNKHGKVKFFNNPESANKHADIKKVNEEILDESWNKGASSSNHIDRQKMHEYQKKASKLFKQAEGNKNGPKHFYHELMSKAHTADAKFIKHAYHADRYGNKAIAKKDHDIAMAKAKEHKSQQLKHAQEWDKKVNEEILDELSKNTLKSYSKKAAQDIENLTYAAGRTPDSERKMQRLKKSSNRIKGISKAVDKISEAYNINDFEPKHVQGLHNFKHYEHPDGTWIQKMHGKSYHVVVGGKGRKHTTLHSPDELKKHLSTLSEELGPENEIGTDAVVRKYRKGTPGQENAETHENKKPQFKAEGPRGIKEAFRSSEPKPVRPVKNHPHQAFLDDANSHMKDDSHISDHDKKHHQNPTGFEHHQSQNSKTHYAGSTVRHAGHVSMVKGEELKDTHKRLDNDKIKHAEKLAKKHGFKQDERSTHKHLYHHPETGATLRIHKHDTQHYTDRNAHFELTTPRSAMKKHVNEDIKSMIGASKNAIHNTREIGKSVTHLWPVKGGKFHKPELKTAPKKPEENERKTDKHGNFVEEINVSTASADRKVVKVIGPDGQPHWRKIRRKQDLVKDETQDNKNDV